MFPMTPTILRNLMGKSATRLYPVEQREIFPRVRGHIENDINKCIFCNLCAIKCPSRCLEVTKEGETGTWSLDLPACVACSVCVDVCPTKSISMEIKYADPYTEKELISLSAPLPQKKKK